MMFVRRVFFGPPPVRKAVGAQGFVAAAFLRALHVAVVRRREKVRLLLGRDRP